MIEQRRVRQPPPETTRSPPRADRANGQGWIEIRHVRCGKPTCHCRTGPGHGPYRYQVWRENGRRRARYLGPVNGQPRDRAAAGTDQRAKTTS